ncbi:hypothetical protein FisN_7Hh094 [Fistulifera solaris]|uniref:Fe2OG dioxygenase domain-containing protein n=1 Tax=Fistulifera solaris TaxID=1519565 RepID=A0A1Z5K3M7_FISSO|nr:hypothetical protein FisN_7Hh094 [Fistulifera solaris]|eukprot:GAX20782.1 hypothetical protein FisN_7Hh094 [Fistulifera solaris]
MGHSCSKSTEHVDYAPAGALESDPRQRRSHKKKSNLTLTASGSPNYHSYSHPRISSHGIFKTDPPLFHLQQMSLKLLESSNPSNAGQDHLLYKYQQKYGRTDTVVTVRKRSQTNTVESEFTRYPEPVSSNEQSPFQGVQSITPVEVDYSEKVSEETVFYNTRLVVRRHAIRSAEEGVSGRHIYAVRWPRDAPLQLTGQVLHTIQPLQEQSPYKPSTGRTSRNAQSSKDSSSTNASPPSSINTARTQTAITKTVSVATGRGSGVIGPSHVDSYFHASILASPPRRKAVDWVTVSEEHCIYVADVGLSHEECDHLVRVTEQVCSGQYSAYTYAKQTLGCREYPILASAVQNAVHTVVNAIFENAAGASARSLSLDDREPHMVKYDVTRKERQKLDMHTDKSDWTFLIALSNGCGIDYEGGGTYFEALDATLNVQRGHAVIFPGKLRHCGQRISAGLRFLLVGFLVDKSNGSKNTGGATKGEDGSENDAQEPSTNVDR